MRVYSFYYLNWRHLVNSLQLDNATLKLSHHGVVQRLADSHTGKTNFVLWKRGPRSTLSICMIRFLAKDYCLGARSGHYKASGDGLPLQKFQVCARTNKKAVLSQRWPRNSPYTWVPWKFSGLPDYAHGYYSQHFHGLLFGSALWMFLPNLKSVALSVTEIIGGIQKFGQSLDTPTLPFLENF